MKDGVLQIGVLMGNVFTKHPMEVLRGLTVSSSQYNVNLTILPGAQGSIYDYWNNDEERNDNNLDFSSYNYQYNSLYDYANIAGLDAIIITYGTLMMFLSREEKSVFFKRFGDIPLVVLQEYNEHENYCYLIADNYKGMFEAVSHLIEVHDRKKIVFLGGPKMNTDASERMRGYYDAMRSNGLDVTADMFVYGDYSSNVDYLVEELFDKNPDADAIACANDEMAICAYRVCRKRGLVIGRDISIVGFDDVEIAATLNPPLTTARQDGFTMGRMALELAVKGIEEEDKKLHRMDVPLIIRGSCGCDYNGSDASEGSFALIDGLKHHREPEYIRRTAEVVARDSMDYRFTPASRTTMEEFFIELIYILNQIVDTVVSEADEREMRANFRAMLRTRLDFSVRDDVNWSEFSKYFHRLMTNLIENEKNYDKIFIFSRIMQRTHEHIEAMLIQTSLIEKDNNEKSYWNAAQVIQRLKERVRDEEAFMRIALQQVIAQGAKSAYLLINTRPILHNKGEESRCPDELRLVASSKGEEITIYGKSKKDREAVTKAAGFTRFYPEESGHMYMCFLLFSENEQYGLLVAEITPEQLSGMHGVSMQLSNGLSIMRLTEKEDEAKKELKRTLRQVKDQNKILSTVSSSDPMTGVSNRRGFMEKVLELNRKHEGREAQLFFCDLDHLKQINDEFGHNAGDYAIKTIANVTQEILGDRGCLGRIGGDEFIAMVPCDEDEAKNLTINVKEALKRINKTSGKPYYIECSMGYKSFICTEDVVMDEVIKQADEVMYLDKARRRPSVRKENE